MTAAKEEKLVLFDAHAMLHRAFHALPPLSTSKGEPVGALLGFAKALLKALRELNPAYVAVCYDAPGPTFRDKLYPDYKATRPPLDEALRPQLALAPEVAEALGLKGLRLPGYEADDLLATMARAGREKGLKVVLVTGDKDALQLVDGGVTVLRPEGEIFDAAKVEAKLGVPPERVIDYLALVGDAVDNVPGVDGVGPATAVKLIKRFGGVEGILKAVRSEPSAFTPKLLENLRAFEPRAEKTLTLVRLEENVPLEQGVESFAVGRPDARTLVPLFQRFEFLKLLQEVLPSAAAPVAASPLLSWTELSKRAGKAPELALAVREAAGPADGELIAAPGFHAAVALPDGAAAVCDSPRAAKAVCEGPALKVVHDAKNALGILAAHGVALKGPWFDTALASYLLNPARSKYAIEDAALELLGTPVEPLSGAGGAAAEARLAARLREKLEPELKAHGLDALYAEMELPLMEVLAAMEAAGIGADLPYLRGLSEEFERHIEALKRELDGLAGEEINLHSPKQLAQLLFEKLKLPVQRRNKTGPSTDEETLTVLSEMHPLPAKLLEYREWTKLKSTYIDNLIAEADAKGRVHTHFNQFGAATGRLASARPNLQNIPVRTPLGMKIRRAFAPRHGWTFLSADYSQIDLRVLAHVTKDPALVAAFRRGEDIHAQTAAEIFGVAPEAADKEARRRAKAVNFGIVYGQTPHGLSQQLGIPFKEAQDYIKRYFERYPGVKAWIEAEIAQARKEGLVRTFTGRLRYLPEISAPNAAQRAFAERAATNTPIQGGSADVIKKAMLSIARGLADGRFKAVMLLQVHDELLFECPPDELEELAAWVKAEMEGAVALDVPMVVDLKSGPNWAELAPLAAEPARAPEKKRGALKR